MSCLLHPHPSPHSQHSGQTVQNPRRPMGQTPSASPEPRWSLKDVREVLTNNLEVKKLLMSSPHSILGIRIHVACSGSSGRKKKTGSVQLSKWEWIVDSSNQPVRQSQAHGEEIERNHWPGVLCRVPWRLSIVQHTEAKRKQGRSEFWNKIHGHGSYGGMILPVKVQFKNSEVVSLTYIYFKINAKTKVTSKVSESWDGALWWMW